MWPLSPAKRKSGVIITTVSCVQAKDELEKRIHDSATAIQSMFRGDIFRNKPRRGKRGKGGKRGGRR